MVGNLRYKLVFLTAGHVCDVAPTAILEDPCATSHDIRVYVDRIDRVGHSHCVVLTQ